MPSVRELDPSIIDEIRTLLLRPRGCARQEIQGRYDLDAVDARVHLRAAGGVARGRSWWGPGA
ncbi:MAG: hypothetical protein AB7G37_19080 [Solirubrobacteraceae bacterium]